MAFYFYKKNLPQRKMKLDDFNGQIHYSHHKCNSCGVLMPFLVAQPTLSGKKRVINMDKF